MTTTTMSLLFSSDPKNGAQPLDSTGSRFMVHLQQAIQFPHCKNIDIVLNTASIWYTTANVSASLYDNASFKFTYGAQSISVVLPDGLYSLQDVFDQVGLIADLTLTGATFEKLFSFETSFSVQKVAIKFLANNLSIDWKESSIRKLLGFNSDADKWPGQSTGNPITNVQNKSIQANTVGGFSALTSYFIHSSLVNNGLPINGIYKNILGEVPVNASPGELFHFKAMEPAVKFNANELIGTAWSCLQFWITSQNDNNMNMSGEYWSFSISAICSY